MGQVVRRTLCRALEMQQIIILCSLGSFFVLLSSAAIVLNAVVGSSLSQANLGLQALAFVAVGLNALSTIVAGFCIPYSWTRIVSGSNPWTAKKCWSFIGFGILLSVVAAAVTAVTLAWINIKSEDLPMTIIQRPRRQFCVAWCILWGCSIVVLTALYTVLIWGTTRQHRAQSLNQLSLDFGISPDMQEAQRPETTETVQSFGSGEPTLNSPPGTPTTSDHVSSLRSSLSVAVRPANSRTKLLLRQRSFPRDSKSSSLDLPSREQPTQDDAFDTWDTSSVGREIREAVLHSSPTPGPGTLEPIPGSRPESPANGLDGPFLPSSPNHSSTSLPSSPPNFSRPVSRHRPSSSQDHIHPLFRTTSPTPPPTATPGTVVTAAPIAGQTISGRTFNRMRSGSLPSTSSPLAHPEGASDMNGRSSPGPSIEELPPIPSFVLSAGARSSLLGYGKRKVAVQESAEEESGTV